MVDVGAPVARPAAAVADKPSFVEWPAVFAGAVLAAALSFVFLTFGTAIGLSATSPWPGSGLSAKVIASIAVFWVLAQQIGSLMIGGYVAGRMRTRWSEAGDEAEFRDGLHGGLVWAMGVLFSALLLFATAGAAARTGAEVAGKTAASVAGTADPMDAVIDTMLRPTVTAQAQAPAPPPAAAAQPAPRPRTAAAPAGSGDETRAEVSRIMAGALANGGLTAENRAYLAQVIVQRTGLPQSEAERRIDAAVKAAREAADKARKAAILTGFVTAAGLILSLGAAWWAAMKGGNHRDNSVPPRFAFATRVRTTP
jgi:pyruvate/2-oxoglutarate dehydrogenase complex dihydrolipoamide acyltransferase (E2) component